MQKQNHRILLHTVTRNISNHKTNTQDKRIRNQLLGVTTIVTRSKQVPNHCSIRLLEEIGREPLTFVLNFTLDSSQLFGVDPHGGIRGTFGAICQLPRQSRHDCGSHYFLFAQ